MTEGRTPSFRSDPQDLNVPADVQVSGRVEPRSPREEVVIYAWGLVMMSVCAPASMDAHAVEDSANRQHPTGITSEWTVSREPFRGTSQVSPVACDTDADRRHWLLSC